MTERHAPVDDAMLDERAFSDDADAPRAPDPEAEAEADEFERGRRAENKALLQRLKFEAQGNLGIVIGGRMPRTPTQWAAAIEKAGDEIGNGDFLVRQLGAERYLDPATVLVLLTYRQNLIADLPAPSAADLMRIDAAVIAYFNVLRTQMLMGNLRLAVEQELFGEEGLREVHGEIAAARIEEKVRRLADVLLPLQERANRMLHRSLDALPRIQAKAAKKRTGR
jgi:hypothetical protein